MVTGKDDRRKYLKETAEMKRYLIIGLAIVTMFAIAGCSDNDEQVSDNTKEAAVYQKISQEEAKKMMDEGALVIDVREDYEYADAHIDGAILSPLGNLENDIANHADSKDDTILIYCRSGNRSRTATNILVEQGYTNVYDFGGIIDWTYGTVK